MADSSLTLNLLGSKHFNCEEGDSGYGFERTENEDIELEYNLLGNAFIRVSPYYASPRFQFEWNLFLNSDERSALEMMVSLQRKRLANRETGYEIIVDDEYFPLIEVNPIEREEAIADGDSPSLPTITNLPPTGFTLYYPRYKVVVTEGIQYKFFYDGLWSTRIVGKEVLADET